MSRDRVRPPVVIPVFAGNIDEALRTLKRSFAEIEPGLRRHRHALSPSARRKLKSFRARRRILREARQAHRAAEKRRQREAAQWGAPRIVPSAPGSGHE